MNSSKEYNMKGTAIEVLTFSHANILVTMPQKCMLVPRYADC